MGLFDDNEKQRKYVSNVIISEIMHEIDAKKKAKNKTCYDKEIFDKGMFWYREGMSLEEAPEVLKTNENFIRGYQLASRQDKINKVIENQGAEWYYSGHSLEEALDSYGNNEYFIKGYNDAKNSKKRG